ncbi:MAG: hypothetical protein ACJ76V_00905 [Thermoleophilaceae bacterium]
MSAGGSTKPPEERIRTLLLRGDNVMKNRSGESLPHALDAFEQAGEIARAEQVEPRLAELVERRIESVRRLMGPGP